MQHHRPIILSRDRGCPEIQEPWEPTACIRGATFSDSGGRSCEELVRGHSVGSRRQL